MRKLDYLDKVDYEKLPQSIKDTKSKFHVLNKEIKKLNKRKQKIQQELNLINVDLKSLSKQHTELFNDLKFINKNYNPRCYVVYNTKNGEEYLNLVVKHLGKSKPIYLGKPYNVWEKLKLKTSNLNYRNKENFKNKLNIYFEEKIGERLDYSNPKKLLTDKILFKDLQ